MLSTTRHLDRDHVDPLDIDARPSPLTPGLWTPRRRGAGSLPRKTVARLVAFEPEPHDGLDGPAATVELAAQPIGEP